MRTQRQTRHEHGHELGVSPEGLQVFVRRGVRQRGARVPTGVRRQRLPKRREVRVRRRGVPDAAALQVAALGVDGVEPGWSQPS